MDTTPTPERAPQTRAREPGYHYRAAKVADAFALAPRIREADRREIDAASGREPLEVLLSALESSRVARTIAFGDTVLAMHGATDLPGYDGAIGFPWLIASDDLLAHRGPFLRTSRREANDLLAHYANLYGLVHAQNTVHIRWIEWTGFTLGTTLSAGRRGEAFTAFWRKRNV
jgi:hypothetical protein